MMSIVSAQVVRMEKKYKEQQYKCDIYCVDIKNKLWVIVLDPEVPSEVIADVATELFLSEEINVAQLACINFIKKGQIVLDATKDFKIIDPVSVLNEIILQRNRIEN